MAIVVLVLWLATATAGLTLLRSGGTARRAAAPAAQTAAPVRIGAAPLTADGRPPPIPRARVATPAGDHTLLEFSHPALAVTGVACWTMFTLVHYPPMAWIAFGTLLATAALGLSWLARSRRAGRADRSPGRADWSFPSRLVWLHGLAAALSLVLTTLTAILASRA